MNIWISFIILGAVLTVFGMFVFVRKLRIDQPQKKSLFLMGIFLPMFFASTYAETLEKLFPQITLIDLGGLYLIGMISGFFMGIYLIQRKAVIPKNS